MFEEGLVVPGIIELLDSLEASWHCHISRVGIQSAEEEEFWWGRAILLLLGQVFATFHFHFDKILQVAHTVHILYSQLLLYSVESRARTAHCLDFDAPARNEESSLPPWNG